MTLAVERLSKRYDQQQVFNNLSLAFQEGERVLIVGSNGAGKSTFLRCMVGLVRPDSGRVLYASGTKPKFGYVGHHSMVYSHLSVEENIHLYGSLSSKSCDVSMALKDWGLTAHAKKKVSQLSKGLQSRLSLCRAFINDPKYFVLDEPTAALDDESVALLSSNLKRVFEVHSGKALAIMATHDLHRVRDFATRVVLLGLGSVIADSLEHGIDKVLDLYRSSNR